ncbi:MAG TPA: hypothetical protein VLJ17_14270 [Xanthobacteraceae bacterium]|nr:hypothetical protein [Xanthobacteraceae bacterium]
MAERVAIGKRLEIGGHGEEITPIRMSPLMEFSNTGGLFAVGMDADIFRGRALQRAMDIQGSHEALRPNKIHVLHRRAFLAVGEKFGIRMRARPRYHRNTCVIFSRHSVPQDNPPPVTTKSSQRNQPQVKMARKKYLMDIFSMLRKYHNKIFQRHKGPDWLHYPNLDQRTFAASQARGSERLNQPVQGDVRRTRS